MKRGRTGSVDERGRLFLTLILLTLLSWGSLRGETSRAGILKLSEEEKRQRIGQLDESSLTFLRLATPIMPPAELDAFLLLEDADARNERIEEFWSQRTASGSANAWIGDYERRFAESRQLFGDREGDRAQVYLLRGRPSTIAQIPCPDYFHPMEVWTYDSVPGFRESLTLLFYKPDARSDYTLLRPDGEEKMPLEEKLLSREGKKLGPVPIFLGIPENPSEKGRPIALDCPGGASVLEAIALAKDRSVGVGDLLDRSFLPRPEEEAVKVDFVPRPAGESQVPLEAEVLYPGKRGGRTATSIRLRVDSSKLGTLTRSEREIYAFTVRGEVRESAGMIDRFWFDYEIPARSRDMISLVIERFLPPEDYELAIHVKDQSTKREGYLVTPIVVPYIEPIPRGELGGERSAAVAVIEQDFRPGRPSIRLVPLGSGFFTGRQRIETLVAGEGIASVEFSVDGEVLMAKRQPPYTLELDLGDVPTTTTIRVVGRDAEGRVIAGDEMVANGGSDPFRVHIVSPRVSQGLKGEIRVEVAVNVPLGHELEKIELFVNDYRVATGYESPMIQTIQIPSPPETTFLRAVATIDGEAALTAEDVVLLNTPQLFEEIDVRLVELPTTVMRRGEIVDDLTVKAFEVLEEGRPVEIDKFDYVRDLPLSIGMAIDSSGSMRPRMDDALRTGARFFDRVMKPGDKAFLLAFSDQPQLIQGWTDNLTNLTAGLASLDAAEMTALYDAVIHALYNFQGLSGQKALILLSDGQDTASSFSFDQALEYARKTAIPIYTIGIGIRSSDSEIRSKLRRLATETGAESYFIDASGGLRDIYDEIERQLRSQYILGFYPPPQARDAKKWRRVEVNVAGASAKTVSGYYP